MNSQVNLSTEARNYAYFTYKDYEQWPEEDRYELFNGVPYMMSSPSAWHQHILGELYFQFKAFLRGKTCTVFIAPFDVRLFPMDDDSGYPTCLKT